MQAVIVGLATVLLAGDSAGTIDSHSLICLKPSPVATDAGQATIDLPGAEGGRNYLIVVGSTQRGERRTKVEIRSTAVDQCNRICLDRSEPAQPRLRELAAKRKALQAKRDTRAEETIHAVGRLAENREFYVFVAERDFWNTAHYQRIRARLVGVGERCLVYVDQDDLEHAGILETVHETIDTFDQLVFPKAREQFGKHLDVDRNGKFTILFTHWLGKLSSGRVSLGGFVRGSDFYRDIDAPFSNQCDMLYLNSNLAVGAHLRTLLAHEYAHAITFCEHVFGDYLPGEGGLDEESWLNEGISHLAENLAGEGWSNLDYRISTFLTSPSSYRLVVPDYHRAGLWRCHGSRGSTFLFLRYCVDRFGDSLLRELAQSNLRGVTNLEVATQMPFEELFRDWTVALCLAGFDKSTDVHCLHGAPLHGRLESRLLAGPRHLQLEEEPIHLTLAPTSAGSIRVHVPANESRRLTIAADSESQLQVTLVRLPDEAPTVTLAAELSPVDGDESTMQARLRVQHHRGGEVRWTRLSWEPAALPQTSPDDGQDATIVHAKEAFTTTTTAADQELISEPIDLPIRSNGKLAIKLVGADPANRPISAWCIIEQPSTKAAGN